MGRHARRLQRVRRGEANREKQETAGNELSTTVDINADKFFQDEVEEFHEAKEKLLLEGDIESSEDDELSVDEEEVMGLDLEEEEEEEEEEDYEEDYEEEFQLPPALQRQLYASDDEHEEKAAPLELSEKAWGKERKSFYAREDEIRGGSGGESEAEEMEEREAMTLQQRMATALKDSDFEGPKIPIPLEEEEEGAEKEERVLQDFSKLSREDKLALLEKESPELFDLLEEFDSKFSEAIQLLHPLATVAKDTSAITPQGREYFQLKLHLYLIYSMNILFYLRMKASRLPVQNHPVIERIVQIRTMIGRLQPLDEQLDKERLKEMVEELTTVQRKGEGEEEEEEEEEEESGKEEEKEVEEEEESGKEINSSQTRSIKRAELGAGRGKMAGVVWNEVGKKRILKRKERDEEEEDLLSYYESVKRAKEEKRRRKEEAVERRKRRMGGGEESDEVEEEGTEDGKRAITYQISRNKGLTPHRRKEQRNPRVKHRRRYRKALIKRKSQVRGVETELTRYGGERTGIRANISHSIRIK